MKVLVTGGAGYIGSHTIVDLLENADFEVISLDNYINSTHETFDRIEAITGVRVRNYAIDICDERALRQLFKQETDVVAIIHFAALKAVGESVAQPLRYYANNVGGLINLLQCADQVGIRRIIFSSSCTVYGNAAVQPVTENTPLAEAESPYGYTKLVGETILRNFCLAQTDARCIALRYFNPVGAHASGLIGELPLGEPNNLVPLITRAASGVGKPLTVYGSDYKTRDGSPVRDYVHVSDVAHAHVLALEKLSAEAEKFDVINLGSEQGNTVGEVITAFERATGVRLPHTVGQRRPGDVEVVYADCAKAARVLGWKAQRSLEECMLSAWRWQQRINGDDRARLA